MATFHGCFLDDLSLLLTIARLLRYAIVTRPVRQGRLKLALEEVLSSQPDPDDPSLLQTPHASAAAAPSACAVTTSSSSSGSSLQLASSPGRPPPGMFQSALGQNGNGPRQIASLQRRHDSHQSSGLLSHGSSTSGSLLPSPCELAPMQSMGSLSGSNPSSHGAELENALHTRRHSLHRAPKVCPFLAYGPHPPSPKPKGLSCAIRTPPPPPPPPLPALPPHTAYTWNCTVLGAQVPICRLCMAGGHDKPCSLVPGSHALTLLC